MKPTIPSYKGIILTLVLLLSCANGYSQFNQVRNLNVEDGLPSPEVYDMLQDSKGFMWFATDMGVSRFNGAEFENFNTENGLPDNSIFGLNEDASGKIWFRSFSGKLSYFLNDSIYALKCNDKLSEVQKIYISLSQYTDKKGTVWIGLNSNAFISISPPYNDINVKLIKVNFTGNYFCPIDSSGIIFGGDNLFCNTLRALNTEGKVLYEVKPSILGGQKSTTRSFVSRFKNKTYFASINNVLFSFNDNKVLFETAIDAPIIDIKEDFDHSILTASYNGILAFPSQGTTQTGKNIATEKAITSILIDKDNSLWYTSEGQGVYYIPYRSARYFTKANQISSSKITSIVCKEGNVYTGHMDGSVDDIAGALINKNEKILSSISTRKERIHCIYISNENKMYVGKTTTTSVLDLNKFSQPQKQISIGIKKIIHDSGSEYLALGQRRIFRLKLEPEFVILKTLVTNTYLEDIYKTKNGQVLFSSPIGLFKIVNDTFELFDKSNSLLSARVVNIKEDAKNRLWLATRGAGVVVKIGKIYHQIKKENGLASNMCREIYIDSKNTIWVGSNNGVTKITVKGQNPFTYNVNVYSKQNGLLSNEVNHIIEYENKIWLTHNNSISIFDRDSFNTNFNPPLIYITNVTVDGKTINGNKITIQNDQQNFSINYIGISYKNPEGIEYKYKIDDSRVNWIYTKNKSAQFQQLEPGSYNFVVYAKSSDGFWSHVPDTLQITILPSWWQTWWFRTLCILLFVGIVFISFKIRFSAIQKRENEKAILQNKITSAELKALRAQMNPHFIFNAINSVQHFITANDPESSQKYLAKFSKLIRYVLDNSKPTAISLEKELEAITLYLEIEKLRFEKKFEYSIKVDPKIDTNFIQIPSMLIQPFIENSLWHGIMHKNVPGKIEITFDLLVDSIKCTIEDDGIGRTKSQEIRSHQNTSMHNSLGSKITQDRLEIINQLNKNALSLKIIDLYDAAGLASGTRVELFIPQN